MTEKQLRRFTFILNEHQDLKLDGVTLKNFKEALKVANHWVFQLEKGEEKGRLHYQGRVSFKQAKRKNEVLKLFPDFPTISIKIEGPDEVKSSFYCMKVETRIDGPWKDTDTIAYIPRQVRECMDSWYPWQRQIIDSVNLWEPRRINLLIDKHGGKGKSVCGTFLGSSGLAEELPYCNDFKDMMRMVYDLQEMHERKCPAFVMDMPRSLNKQKLQGMYAGLEIIKKGYAYDDRYSFRRMYFDSPVIWVFTNEQPDLSWLTLDRWKLWEIHEGNLRQATSIRGTLEQVDSLPPDGGIAPGAAL